MNKIISPITKCGNAGFDAHNQLWLRVNDGSGRTTSTVIHDPRGRTCPICGKGWDLTVEGLRDQWIRHSYTGLLVTHYRCMEGYYSLKEREFVWDILGARKWHVDTDLGIEVDEIPNEYGAAWNTPWFRIRFTKVLPGVDLVIGSRKRVWEIGVRNLNTERIDDLVLTFAAAKVTDTTGHDGPNWYVHAWNKEQVVERVRMVMSVLLPEAASVAPTTGAGAHEASEPAQDRNL